MRRAQPAELQEDAVPVVVLKVSEPRLRTLFPVRLSDMDALSEAEPSKGALIQLDSGGHVLLTYGLITSRATISFPAGSDAPRQLSSLLEEVPIAASDVEWVRDDAQDALTVASAGRKRSAS